MATFHLVIEPPAGGRYEHRLGAGSYVLGREQGGCDLAIASPEISRRHVRLTLGETQCTVEDLGSTSGTYHSGQAVRESRVLAYPLELHLGTVRLQISLATQQASDTNGSGLAGHYTKGAEIAKGGMGAVLEANDQLLGRTVAMKVVRHDIGDSESIRLRFIREATVLARLEHPSIVPIYEMGKDAEGRLYYTMKKVEGRTLQAILDDLKAGKAATVKEFTLDRLLNIYRKICEAMAFAHAKGVIHRDLKPENVMVGAYGEVLVMDWGLAKVLYDVAQTAQEMQLLASANSAAANPKDSTLPSGFEELSDSQMRGSSQNLTVDGAVMGSPQYMPPEQAEGKVGELDERADVFSLGGVLYAILTLKPPVEGRTVKEVLDKVKSGNIVPPTHFNIGSSSANGKKLPAGTVTDPKQITPLPHCPGGRVPGTLSAITMKALAFDREQRYGSVGELLADVEAYQRGFATSAEDVNLLGQLGLLMKRHRGITVSVVVALLLIAGLTGGFVWRIGQEKIEALAQADRATEEAAKAKLAEQSARRAEGAAQIALAEAAFRSLDLEGMVKALEACPPANRDQTWEYLSAKRDASLRDVLAPGWKANEVESVLAVPGRKGVFALAGARTQVELLDVAANRIVQRVDTGETGRKAMSISGDGKVMAVWAVDKAPKVVQLFQLADGRRSGTLRLSETEPAARQGPLDRHVLRLNRDGSRLVMGYPVQPPELQLIMLNAQTGTKLWSQEYSNAKVDLHPDGSKLAVVTSAKERFFRLLGMEDGKELIKIAMNSSSVAFSPDGRYIAIGSLQGSLHIMDGKTGAGLQQGKLYTGEIAQLAWTADNLLLSMGSEGDFNNRLALWRLALWYPENLQPMGSYFGLGRGDAPAWSLDPVSGYLLVEQNPPRLWRIPVGVEAMRTTHGAEQGWTCIFPDNDLLLARGGSQRGFGLSWYDMAMSGAKVDLPTFDGTVSASAVHWKKGLLAMSIRRREDQRAVTTTLKLFSYQGGKLTERWELKIPLRVFRLDFDADGEQLVIAAGTPNNADVVSVATGKTIAKFKNGVEQAVFAGSQGRVVTLPVNRQTTTASASTANLLQWHDAKTGKVVQTNVVEYSVADLAVSPDRSLLALVGGDQMVHVLEADTMKERTVFRAHDDEIMVVAFHPTRPVVATASKDGSVKLWDYTTKKMVNHFIGLRGTPVCLAFSPNGKWLAVEGQENTFRVYEVSEDMLAKESK